TAKQLGLHIGDAQANPDGIHRSLLAGLLSQIGLKDSAKKDYVGARQTRFVIFPGSAVAKKQPAAVMSAELVETSRLFARMNAAIDPVWAEAIAGDLVKRTYSEPHWERKQGASVAFERVTLYGVPIVVKRRVQFSRIDPQYARELFIRHALVDGDVTDETLRARLYDFDRANKRLRAELSQLEERTRRRDILFDDEAIFDFYHRRIPPEVASIRDFEGWWRTARTATPDLLTMTAENLVDDETPDLDHDAFPSTWQQRDQSLDLSYRFEPGTEDDGVTVSVPLPLLAGLTPDGFDWQVPGLREELVTSLIRSLPKSIRRHVVPATDWARTLLAEAGQPEGSLTAFLAREITTRTYTPVTAADFDLDRVAAHLRVTFAVMDDRGTRVASGKTLSALQASLKPIARASVARVTEKATAQPERDPLERVGIISWDFDELDRSRDTRHGANTIRAYPALIDERTSVSIRLMSTPEDQAATHRLGVRRLLLLAIPSPTGYVQEHLTTQEKLVLAQSPYRTNAALFEDCMIACIDAVIGDGQLFTRAGFETARDAVSATIVDSLFQAVALVSRITAKAREADKAIRSATSLALIAPLGDARSQLDALVFDGFVSSTGLERLRRIPAYLDGIIHRIAKLLENPARDRVWMGEVQLAQGRYVTAGGTLPLDPAGQARIIRARWMLEELRLSLFAQHIATIEPVSLQRITKLLAD
ncbi:MAG: DUF3418 domain-containing protein, partial [Salinibacterium sp.]|nr:DUF3418 domain-containing protein [Salinibacterium sp.]